MTKKEASIRILELTNAINNHNRSYYVDNAPVVSDFEYDLLMQELQGLEKKYPELISENSPSQKVGSDIGNQNESERSFRQISHIYPMLSLSNTYDKEELATFDNKIVKAIGENIKYTCELKLDGSAISLTYQEGVLIRALTRGDGIMGDDVTENIMRIKSIPHKLTGSGYPNQFEIRGEIFMPWHSFDKINLIREEEELPLFANPRNAAAGTIKLLDSSEIEKRGLECILYNLISKEKIANSHYETLLKAKEWSLPISDKMQICNNLNEIYNYLDHWEKHRTSLPYATDGVVIKVDNLSYQDTLGSTSKSPRWATAYKFKPEQATTKLLSIDYQVGRSGVITPVANLTPVQLSGTIVKRATLHNKEQIELLDIHLDDYVIIEKGGEIIPKITGVDPSKRASNAQMPIFPSHCPDCGAQLIRDPSESKYYCPNNYACSTQIKGSFLHFTSRKAMNILAGEATIDQLYKLGYIKKLYDLYNLSAEQLMQMDGWKERAVERFLKSIENSKSRNFENVLYAIGIRHIGENSARTLAYHFETIENLENSTMQELISVPDIGETVATTILEYFSNPRNIDTIEGLKNAGLRFTLNATQKKSRSDKLKGYTIVISGNFSISRDDMKKLIEEHAGKNSGSVGPNTSFLLSGEKTGPAKLQKASAMGIKIITEDEFFKMIND